MQETKSKTSTKTEAEVPEVETTADTSRSQEVSEEAACCLLDIDEALKEHEERELTADEIYAKGMPDLTESEVAALADLYQSLIKDEITTTEYLDKAREIKADYRDQMNKYKQAYETVTGMTFDPCVCG